tara:strand:+ start:1687 stop:2082 length:396 start_codon:yes stop_codon:yes gene_type:complete
MSLEQKLNKDSAIDFYEGINRLLSGIKKDYASWGSNVENLSESQKKIRQKMIDEFNQNLDIRVGRKYTKVMTGSSVWGFVANSDGMLKGIPYFKGDVFKAAGWRAPAKHVRGSIFDTNQNWFRWTGPNYIK